MSQTTYDTEKIEIYINDIVKSSSSSFYWAMRLLPTYKKNAIFAIYAFCRQIDDIADEPAPIEIKKQRLNDWTKAINDIYEGKNPTYNPIACYLKKIVHAFSLPKEEFLELIRGMEMDTHDALNPPSLDTLRLYCRRVAGAVGLLSIHIFGAIDDKSKRFAIALGEAMQLTNILRDTQEDFDMGRIYLPKEFLEANGIGDLLPNEIISNPAISNVRKKLADLAELRYTEARMLLTPENKNALKPAIMMMNIYHKILEKMQERGWDKISPKVKLSKIHMLWIALRS